MATQQSQAEFIVLLSRVASVSSSLGSEDLNSYISINNLHVSKSINEANIDEHIYTLETIILNQ